MTAFALADRVAAEANWMEDLLVRLVEAPTVLGAEESGQDLMADAFAACDLVLQDVPLDAARLRADPHSSPFSWSVDGKRNVTATWEAAGRGGRSLILNGHIDVVPAAAPSLWRAAPFIAVRDGDWLYGRGACDMKAGLVAMTGAVRALRRADVRLAADLHLQSVIEEECTGNGTLQCLLDGPPADACVITEPHHDHFTIAQMGVLWFHVDVRGAPAHAARARQLGHNAIDAVQVVLAALRRLEAELNIEPPGHYRSVEHPVNLNPGVISGGDWTSTVATECTLSCRLAQYPGQHPSDLRRRVEDTIATAAAQHPFLADHPPVVRYDGFSCEGCVVGADEPLVGALAAAYRRRHGTPPALRATTATTDARHFVRSGIPAICYGPRGENIHGIDERVSLASMLDCATVLADFITGWCGVVDSAPAALPDRAGEVLGA